MSFAEILDAASGLLFLWAAARYINEIRKRRKTPDPVRPIQASWIVWAVQDSISLWMMREGEADHVYLIAAAAFEAWVVVGMTLVLPSERGWKPIDKVCVGLAGVAVIAWLISGDAGWGLFFSLVATLAAAVPTIDNVRDRPQDEDRPAWTINWFADICGAGAAYGTGWIGLAQPLIFLLRETIMLWLLWRPRRDPRS